jgi:uncharacterized damage-inducible protein DinB
MRMGMMVAAGLLAGCTAVGGAQMGASAAAPAPGTVMAPSKAADELLNLFEQELMGVVKEMPADKYTFAPNAANFASSQGSKYEGVRTFGQQVAHLAQANYFFYSMVSGEKPDTDVKAIGSMTTKDQLVAALQSSFAFAHKATATLTPANAFEEIKGADGMHSRISVANFAVAHGYDHYGQLIEYLRMNGMVPPGSK